MNWQQVLDFLAPNALAEVRTAFQDADAAFSRFDLTTPGRQAHFLAQALNETGGFRVVAENLNYSATRIVQVWPSRFPTVDAATPYARNPQALAEKVYGGRMGNDQPGDGWRYHGRGLLQLTGREAYRLAGRAVGFDLEADPDAALSPTYLIPASLSIWTAKKCNAVADKDDIREITRRVNGGYIGLKARVAWLAKAKAALGVL